MRRKRNRKRWAAFVLAGLLALPATAPVLAVQGAAAGDAAAKGGSYIKNGTCHIDQFGEYDIDAEVTVADGKITDVKITGGNFGGTYAEVNKGKLQTAIDGIVEKFFGLADDDAEGIRQLDAVTSATYSSNGIKEAVADALGLELAEETAGDVPDETPEPGIYDVTAEVRSDVVDHSLVQTETTKAVLTVSEDGRMSLSYTMVSGTEQEPMYILGFNGYYRNNAPADLLSMEGVTYKTEERGDYTVVTDVTFPLTGLSRYYYNNTSIYVPAMSGLNGEISGIHFENGKFSVKTIVTVYWDTLTEHTAGEGGEQSMDISANVPDQISGPCGTVEIPSSLALGGLKQTEDNIQSYEIRVLREDPGETVTVSAPDGGRLYSGKEELSFSNDFGTQTVRGDGAGNTADTEEEAVLKGTILIQGKDVAEAAPGNYTGVTTFVITCSGESTDPGGEEDPDGEEEPDGQKDPDNPGNTDIRDLEDGVYSVTGKMLKVDKSTLSMADNAISHTMKLTVKDGVYSITLNMKGMNISGRLGYLGELQYFLSGYTEDQYGYPQGELGEVVVESYQTDADGNRIRDEYGTDYPDLVTFELIPEALEDGFVPLRVSVPVMDSISEGLGDQSVYLALDWASLKTAEEDDPAFSDEEDPGSEDNVSGTGGLNGGTGLGENTLPGGSSLGGGLSGNGTLGNSSPGGNSLQSGSAVKTGDNSCVAGLWSLVLASGWVCLVTGMVKIVIGLRNMGQKDRKQR